MLKNAIVVFSCCFVLFSNAAYSVPDVSGEPIIVQHLGKIDWPQDDAISEPYLTQLSANDINDLHGDVTCDLIISTPGNYHMALREAMKGVNGFIGLQQQAKELGVTVCWSTSPPISLQQIPAEDLQFKNIHLKGRPALAMAPGPVMTDLVDNGLVEERKPFLKNRGNVILLRADKKRFIKDICDLGGKTRVVTPHPSLEQGSFGNFSGTIFNVAELNNFGCDATTLFNGIFSQDASAIDTSSFSNPYDIRRILKVFNRGKKSPRWVASSRIMHRDVPYALCHNEADTGVIFYHLAKYLKETLGKTGCKLDIVPLGGTEESPDPLAMPGNRVGTLFISKVIGDYPENVLQARDIIYDFLTESPVWTQILNEHGMDDPSPN